MNNKIELRDFFAAQLMSGKVDDFYSNAYNENLASENETPNWKQVRVDEATNINIERAAKNAYKIADALLQARHY